jgi:hypothetical protein
MAAATNGARIAEIARHAQTFEAAGEGMHHAQGSFLDELPGMAFGLITLAYIATSLLALL